MTVNALSTHKRNYTENQTKFLDLYLKPSSPVYGNIKESLVQAGYSTASKHEVLNSLKEEIIEAAKGILSLSTFGAAKHQVDILTGSVALETKDDVSREKLRSEVAQDILDRAGISKQSTLNVNNQVSAIVLLPSKNGHIIQTEEPIDVDYIDITPNGNNTSTTK